MRFNFHVNISLKHQSKFDKIWVVMIIVLMIGLGAGDISAAPFSQFVVFGDGFSDQQYLRQNGCEVRRLNSV